MSDVRIKLHAAIPNGSDWSTEYKSRAYEILTRFLDAPAGRRAVKIRRDLLRESKPMAWAAFCLFKQIGTRSQEDTSAISALEKKRVLRLIALLRDFGPDLRKYKPDVEDLLKTTQRSAAGNPILLQDSEILTAYQGLLDSIPLHSRREKRELKSMQLAAQAGS